MSQIDVFTLEIIQNALQAIADEMFAAMRQTAMSPIIYEVLDMGTGITDASGEIASSGAGIPAFIGVLDKAVKFIIKENSGVGDIEPGDVFITNDPHSGGVSHLNDVILAMPVFSDGKIVAWTANIAHWNDVGGMVPGSISTEATEIYQEGLRLTAVKLISKGKIIRSVVQILCANSRMPDFLEGDMWAGVAAVRSGERRIVDLAKKYGTDVFLDAITAFMSYGEEISRRALRELPKGRFDTEEMQDDGKVFKVAVELSDDQITIDLRDNPAQVSGPINLSRDGTIIAAQMAFKAISSPQGTTNGGTFRPVKVLTTPGTLFDAVMPAAEGFYFENLIRVHDLILRCLAPHMPERLPAGNFSSVCATVIGGTHPDTGRAYTLVEPEIGGWGGDKDGDGNNAVFSGLHGETYNCPVEVCEARYGIYVDRFELNSEPGGHGKHRGGRGIMLDYRIRSDGSFITCGYTRSKILPWGLEGGREGSPNYVEVIRAQGGSERYSFVSGLSLNKDDVVRIRTGSGGGYGDPLERDPESVKNDVRNEYLTPESAQSVYQVTV